MNHFWKEFKPIFIVSSGRTGTKFIATLISKLFKDIDARHEPKPNIIKLRYLYGVGTISLEKAKKIFIKRRANLYNSVKSSNKTLYIESNPYLILLIPIIQETFNDFRIINIIRDGRDWVRSAISRGIFGSYIYRNRLPIIPVLRHLLPEDIKHTKFRNINIKAIIRDMWRIRAIDFKDDPYYNNWRKMTQFEKLTWNWSKIDEIAYEATEGDGRIKNLYFEDIFNKEKNYKGFHELVRFSNLEQYQVNKELNLDLFFSEKINLTKDFKIPHWSQWSDDMSSKFYDIAGDRLKFHGYI